MIKLTPDLLQNVVKYLKGRPDISKEFPDLISSKLRNELKSCKETIKNGNISLVRYLDPKTNGCTMNELIYAIEEHKYNIALYMIINFKNIKLTYKILTLLLKNYSNTDIAKELLIKILKCIDIRIYDRETLLYMALYEKQYEFFNIVYKYFYIDNKKSYLDLSHLNFRYLNRFHLPIFSELNRYNIHQLSCKIFLERLLNTNYHFTEPDINKINTFSDIDNDLKKRVAERYIKQNNYNISGILKKTLIILLSYGITGLIAYKLLNISKNTTKKSNIKKHTKNKK